jgi:hypothetical protein
VPGTFGGMAKKPRTVITFEVDDADAAALEILLRRMPNADKNKSQVYRAIFRMGMPLVAKNLLLTLTAAAPSLASMQGPQLGVTDDASADETLPPGVSTLRATPVASVDLSAPAVQRAKEAREEETAAEEERRPRVSTSKIIRRELEDPPVLPGDPKRRDRRRKPGQAPS